MTAPAMQLTEINGVNLELFDQGAGEPVVFIHGGGSIECHAVLQEPALTSRFRLIHFHRRGYGASEQSVHDPDFAQHAADCRAILEHLGIERAHFAGESVGGSILLQYARDYPETVGSLALLEPVFPAVIGESPQANAMLDRVGALYESGDNEGAIDAFFQEVAGHGYRPVFDRTLPPGWFDQLVDEADTIVQVDSAALGSWTFTAEDAARITRPVLNMAGSDTRSFFRACHDTVSSWMPHAENVILAGATHCMLESNPDGAARQLADFFSRHPIVR